MAFSGILGHVVLVRTDVRQELSASFIRVTRISELATDTRCEEIPSILFLCSVHQLLVTTSVVPNSPVLVTLMKEALSFFKTSVLTRVTQRNIPEKAILHSHHCENLKSYITTKCLRIDNQITRPKGLHIF
jgi:hypothetical protein